MGIISRIRSALAPGKARVGHPSESQGLPQIRTISPFDTSQAAFNAGYEHLKLLGEAPPSDWFEAFEGNSRLQIPVRAIADDISVVKASAVRRTVTSMVDGDFQDVPAPRSAMARWIENPNPFFTFGQMMFLTSIYFDVSGIVLWRLVKGPMGLETWPIPPSWITSQPNDKQPNWKINWFSEAVDLTEEEVLYFYRPKLRDPYREWTSPARAVDNEVAIDNAMGEFLAYSFANEATPSVIVGLPDADPDTLEREHAKWVSDRAGTKKARKAVFINSEAKVTQFRSNHRELEFNEGRRLTRDLILQAYGVPPERAGVLENANRSTIDGADFQQQSKNVLPRLNYFSAVINKRLAPRLGKEIIVFENPVRESLTERLQTAEKIARLGIGTVNEARKMLNLAPTKDAWGNYVPVPVNNVRWYDPASGKFIVVEDPDALREPQKSPMDPQFPQEADNGPEGDPEDLEEPVATPKKPKPASEEQ